MVNNNIMWIKVLIIIIFCLNFINCEIAVLLLARGGSKGVHLKNLQKVGGKSLIGLAIEKVNAAGLHDITISTDHPLIALEAIKYNATVFHRSHVTASDWAPSIWGAAEFLTHRPEVTILVLIQVTSPFIRSSHIREAVNKINHPTAFDCVFSVTRSFKLRWQLLNDQTLPLNFNPYSRPRRQEWVGELIETGAFYITRKPLIFSGYFQNNNCSTVVVSATESLEVDTYYDLQVANALLKANL